jgi:hypothetical protein
MRREASLTRTHFRHARKPLPGWVGDVELRVPLAIEYLIERLERKR